MASYPSSSKSTAPSGISYETARSGFKYDVFISFRGEDTRVRFTAPLYEALKEAGIRTCQDDEIFVRAIDPEQALSKAIRESACSLIIFSEGYASSMWCLKEVAMIIKEHETSKHEVIPVFYRVEPSDVRNQTGSFGEAFDSYEREKSPERVYEWEKSLRYAANLPGIEFKGGNEYDVITMIVNLIIEKADDKGLLVGVKLVGMEKQADKIELWLNNPSSDAVVLIIDGVGGIGKSTIARSLFNRNFRKYEASCFLANIDEKSNQPGGLLRLQSQLLSTILSNERWQETIRNVDEATTKITNAISNKKVLVVLDGVTTSEQVKALLGSQKFYPGSKVIITTRDSSLLTAFEVVTEVHSVATLSTDDAIELFNLHAFHETKPNEPPYSNLSQHFVHHCFGVPLALKVLGSSLHGKPIDVWKATLRKLEAMPSYLEDNGKLEAMPSYLEDNGKLI